MQKVEGVKDQAHAPCPVGRGLGFSEARQTIGADAAQFAIEIGGLRPHGRERHRHAGISGCPVEAGAFQKLGLAAFDARRHAETIELDLALLGHVATALRRLLEYQSAHGAYRVHDSEPDRRAR